MDLKTIDWKIEDEIGHLVLNQPPANTMTRLFFEELSTVTGLIIPDSAIKALIIYGKGRHFSSGADHSDLRSRIIESYNGNKMDELPPFMKKTMESFSLLNGLPYPTFAAIRGTCLGSALELALVCKYRICAEGTVFGFPETSFGLMPGCGGTVRLPAFASLAKSIEIIIGGKNFSAEEAKEWGVVHQIAKKKELLDTTIRMAEELIKLTSLKK